MQYISFHFTSIRLLITLSLGFNATFPPHIHTDVHIPLINTEIDVFVTFFCSAFIRLPLFVRVCLERAVKLEDGLYQSKSCPNQAHTFCQLMESSVRILQDISTSNSFTGNQLQENPCR